MFNMRLDHVWTVLAPTDNNSGRYVFRTPDFDRIVGFENRYFTLFSLTVFLITEVNNIVRPHVGLEK